MTAPLEIRLFGAFAVQVGDQPVPEGAWRLRKAKSLVKLLALSPERRVHRERATEWLWPDRKPDAAANNFHQALYVVRRAFEAAGAEATSVVPLKDDMLLLHPGGEVRIDVDEFEAAAARARGTRAIDDYRAALDLHGGELLPEDRYEAWAATRRDALGETHLGLLLELAELLTEAGDPAGAIEVLDRAVVAEPLHEGAHRALMRLFARTGRRQAALAQYQQLRAALRRELEDEPDPQTRELYRALLRGDAATEPGAPRAERSEPPAEHRPRPAAAPARHNLPIPLTSFVGRRRELREVGQLLDRSRLVTLTGAGGAGKTRLALEAGRTKAKDFADGAWLAELAGLSDPALVPQAVAAALAFALPSKRAALDELSVAIGERRLLIVLDNCEHLIGACAELASHLLARSPRLTILATSREPLRIPGEVTWRVPSLALPSTRAPAHPGEVADSESVELFCERAAESAPGFALDADNAAPVAEICLRLDGMPLALELAAARVGALSPAQIAERLGDSLAVLTGGSRAALDRQQTLRATLGWSHDLLTSEERVQFRRLAVFAGGFSLEAAEAVTAGEPLAEAEVADLVARLVDKSLVLTDEAGEGYRYRLLEPMRQYAHERLVESGEAGALQARHNGYYLGLAWAADPEGAVAEPSVSPARLERDHDNLRAALGWALREEPELALSLAVHTWPMWMAGSHFREGRRWVEAALAAAPEPSALRADALRALAALDVRLGRAAELRDVGAELVDIFRRLGDRAGEAHALDQAGVYAYLVSDFDEAEQLFAEGLALARELDEGEKVAATVLHSQAVLAHCRADFAEARERLLESLALLRAVPEADSEPFFRVHTAGLFVAPEGPGGVPRMHFEETLQAFRRVDARRAAGYVLAALGDVARAQGLNEPARERLNEALELFRELRDAMGTAFVLGRLGNQAIGLEEWELGREWLEEALDLRRALGDRRGTGMTLASLGALAGCGGDTDRARSIVGEAFALFQETEDVPGQMGMQMTLAGIEVAAGNPERARERYEAGRALALEQRLLRCAGWMSLRLAELAIDEGDGERATMLIDRALEELRPLGDGWGVGRALELDQAVAKWRLSGAREG